MSIISISTIQVKSDRWLALALERNEDRLVACTSSQISGEQAVLFLKKALRRLKQLKNLDESSTSPRIEEIGQRLGELSEGHGKPFNLEEIYTHQWSQARLIISKQLLQVPRGKVISYGGLASLTNSSPRGVGSVMRSNPVPWAVPCHRVIHSNGRLGKLGGTISGTKEKARILRKEGVPFNEDGKVNQQAILC